MDRDVYNEHSAKQISQKSRWINKGVLASARQLLTYSIASNNRYRITDLQTIRFLVMIIDYLDAAIKAHDSNTLTKDKPL